ncbi:hypothetical protein SKAU_G00118390, partial [Synaphobranchus kaupii]
MAESGLNTLEPECVSAHSGELYFCTPLSSRKMQAGVCLRQEDTEATLPELTEQHRIGQKEEELSGLESVHMAESGTECAAPELNTLEPGCVSAHSGVSDVHHTHISVIKTETDLVSTHSGDLIKTKSRDSTELGFVTYLHPDQIKTETDDGGYLKAEHISDLQDIKCVDIKSDQMKCESSESSVSDLNTLMNGAGVDHKDQTEPWQYAGEPKPYCVKEEMFDLPNQCGDLSHHCGIDDENNQTRTMQKSTNSSNKHTHCPKVNDPIKMNTSLLNFFQNKTIHGNEGEINAGEKLFKCTQCEKCFTRKSSLTAHQRIHTGEKPFKCTQCEKCFTTNSSLKVHLRIHTGEKPYKCTQCEKSFNSKNCFDIHFRIHTGEKPYKCAQCEKCFNSKCYLDVHLRTHTVEKPFNCTQCEKYFCTHSALNVHLRIHSGEKPYKCRQCEKCFYTNSALNVHLKKHTGEKPYKCTQCGHSFSVKSYLDAHKRIHTGEKPYTCHQCGKCFFGVNDLNKHLRIHTGEKPFKC